MPRVAIHLFITLLIVGTVFGILFKTLLMKSTRLLICLIATAIIAAACNHTIDCKKPLVGDMIIKNNSLDTTIHEQYFTVITYAQGSKYANPLSTTTVSASAYGNNYYYNFEEGKDYELFIEPQHTRYTLTNLHFGDFKKKGSPGMSSDGCYQSCTYILNGTTIKSPMAGTNGSTVIIFIE